MPIVQETARGHGSWGAGSSRDLSGRREPVRRREGERPARCDEVKVRDCRQSHAADLGANARLCVDKELYLSPSIEM
jgi:hypothetical protein